MVKKMGEQKRMSMVESKKEEKAAAALPPPGEGKAPWATFAVLPSVLAVIVFVMVRVMLCMMSKDPSMPMLHIPFA